MAFGNLTIGTATWNKITDGQFLLSTTTISQPTWLVLKNTIRQALGQKSEYLVQTRVRKNADTTYADDTELVYNTTIKYDARRFTVAEVESAYLLHGNFFLNTPQTVVSSRLGELINGNR